MQPFARLLEKHPEHERAVTYLQIASPTREEVGAYAWTPIRYIHRTVPRSHLAGLLRASQAGLVTLCVME